MSEVEQSLRAFANDFSNCTAIIRGNDSCSFGDLVKRAGAVADTLAAMKIERGGRIGVALPNSTEFFILALGLVHAGAIIFPINPALPHRTVAQQLDQVGCKYLVTEKRAFIDTTTTAILSPEQLLSQAASATGPLRFQDDQLLTGFFTSGSTGAPKAAMLTWANHYYSALGSNRNIPFGPGDRWLLSLPLYHVGGMSIFFRALLGGGTIVLPAEQEGLVEAIERNQITHVSVVPTQLRQLVTTLSSSGHTLPHLEAVLVGGAASPIELVEHALILGLPVFTSYGLTEMASQVTTTSAGDTIGRLSSSGKLLPHRHVRISSDGEIIVRGETLFAGYAEGHAIHRPLDSEGWFHTGDMGYMDADGYLSITGRKDNMFISGGENIHPEEIEAVLGNYPGVEAVIVVPVLSARWGHRPVAFIRRTGLVLPETDALIAYAATRLPRFKLPDRIFPWPSDLGMNLKPPRPALRERAEALMAKESGL